MAFGACIAQFSPVRIGVTRDAVGFKPMEESAAQDSAGGPRLVALDTFNFCVAAGQLKFGIFVVVEHQCLAAPGIGRMARGAGIAELTLMGILVAGGAVPVEVPENSAGQDLALSRLVALDTFDFCVVAGQLKFGIFVVVEHQCLAAPGMGRVACGACAVVLAVMSILVARGAILVEAPENSAGQDFALPRLMATHAFGLAVAAHKREL